MRVVEFNRVGLHLFEVSFEQLEIGARGRGGRPETEDSSGQESAEKALDRFGFVKGGVFVGEKGVGRMVDIDQNQVVLGGGVSDPLEEVCRFDAASRIFGELFSQGETVVLVPCVTLQKMS